MRLLPERHPQPLHSIAATREIERTLAAQLPPHTLMARAGLAVARLSMALFPHARTIWVACGPGNNGGDALMAACHLIQWRRERGAGPMIHVSRCGSLAPSEDTAWALAQAAELGIPLHENPPDRWDAAIDGLLGIGGKRTPSGKLAAHGAALFSSGHPVLCIDVPSGLDADTGQWYRPATDSSRTCATPSRHTLTMLTAKPGLFTADGRDAAGKTWLATLQDEDDAPLPPVPPQAWLGTTHRTPTAQRPHATHKGSHGDVAVIGGQGLASSDAGMTGAAVLAARAALHAGAGRVYLGLLDDHGPVLGWDPLQPELMCRRPTDLMPLLPAKQTVTVCGCGGGEAIQAWMAQVLETARTLVLDADALNATASSESLKQALRLRASLQMTTVLTPHPLEAARLLGCSTAEVQGDRLAAAIALSQQTQSICVLKGSGSIIASPEQTPVINASGNPALSTAGTGDVLAGLIGSLLAQLQTAGRHPFDVVCEAVHWHGSAADRLVSNQPHRRITASELSQALSAEA